MTLSTKFSILLITSVFGYFFITKNETNVSTNNQLTIKNHNNITMTQESDYNIIVMNKKDMKFGVSNGKPDTADFYINSNFFKNEGPIGLVVVDGIRSSDRKPSGGYFYVKNGVPYVRSRFCPKKTEFASQTILWAIDNGVVNEGLLETSHAKLKKHRTIMGENAQGQIMIISSSSFFSLVTIEEIINFAKENGMVEGILLDGGSSVDYKCTNGDDTVSFSSVPEDLKPALGITKPFTYIYGNLK
jgi:hypothetical protein